MIVAPASSGRSAITVATPNPSRSGMWLSRSTSGNDSPLRLAAVNKSSACCPPLAVVGRIPQAASWISRMRRFTSLSSTISTGIVANRLWSRLTLEGNSAVSSATVK